MISQAPRVEKLHGLAEYILLRAYPAAPHLEGWYASASYDELLTRLGLLAVVRSTPEGDVLAITEAGRAYIRQHPLFAILTAPRPRSFYTVDFRNRGTARMYADCLEHDVIRLNLPVSVVVFDRTVIVNTEDGEE